MIGGEILKLELFHFLFCCVLFVCMAYVLLLWLQGESLTLSLMLTAKQPYLLSIGDGAL